MILTQFEESVLGDIIRWSISNGYVVTDLRQTYMDYWSEEMGLEDD